MGEHREWLRPWVCGRLVEVTLQLGVDYDGLSMGSFVSMGTTYTLCRVYLIHSNGPCPRFRTYLGEDISTSRLTELEMGT